jgi:hypothetical protein
MISFTAPTGSDVTTLKLTVDTSSNNAIAGSST